MSLLKSREVILAKVETNYGIDPGLSAANDAVLVENPAWSYEGARMYERNPMHATLAPFKPIFAGSLMSITFDVEIKGSGSAGVAPEVGVLLLGCGCSETVVGGTSVTYKQVSSGHQSLTIHYYSDGVWHAITGARGTFSLAMNNGEVGKLSFTFTGHTKMRGTVVSATSTTVVLPSTFSATNNAYDGRTISIISGLGAGQSKTISNYVGSTKTCTVTTWTTNPDSTSVFAIDNGPADIALPSGTYDSTVPAPLIGLGFSVGSFAAVVTKLAVDAGITVAQPGDISSPDGFGEIKITARKTTGSIDPEMTLVATKDFIGQWKAGTSLALDSGVVGVTAGNRYRVQGPALVYTGAAKGDRDGVSTLEMPCMFAEVSGDDELTLAFT